MTRRDLVCVLIGIVLTLGAFAWRAAVQRQEQLEERVAHIEAFVGPLAQAIMQSQR